MGKKIAMLLGAATFLGACTAPKEMVATGGSRADGTVRMSYEYGGFEVPEVNATQGAAAAAQRWRHGGIRTLNHLAVRQKIASIRREGAASVEGLP